MLAPGVATLRSRTAVVALRAGMSDPIEFPTDVPARPSMLILPYATQQQLLRPRLQLRQFTAARVVFAPPAASKDATSDVPAVKKPTGTRLQRIWTVVKKEASHYWHGTKLLGKEIRISARIQGRLLAGKKLTRREHRQVRSRPVCRQC